MADHGTYKPATQTIHGVIVENKSGRLAIRGRVVVDATGDGDVAARAGVPFEVGRPSDGLAQPATLFFKCLNMDWPRAFDYVVRNYAALVDRAKAEVGQDFVLGRPLLRERQPLAGVGDEVLFSDLAEREE